MATDTGSRSLCRRWASPFRKAPSPSGSSSRARRFRPTSRCSRSRPTRSTPRCRARAPDAAADSRAGRRDGRRRHEARRDRRVRRELPRRQRKRRPSPPRSRPPRNRRPQPTPIRTCRPRRSRLLSAPAPAPASPAPSGDGNGDGPSFVSPVVARIASEHGVDVNQVSGSGRGGRVTKKDILEFIESGAPAEPQAAPAQAAPAEAPPAPQPAPAQPAPAAPAAPAAAPAPAAAAPIDAGAGEQVEPMTAMRRGIAEHMRRSLDTSAHVTSAIEVDMSPRGPAPRKAEEGVPGELRGQPDLSLLRRPRRRRNAEELAVGERRDPRRQDRHAQLRQHRLRGRARGRQGADRPRAEERTGPQPARAWRAESPTWPSAPARRS